MKHAPILFALAMFFGAVPAHADGVSFAEANGKYQAGDFKGAEALYKKLLDSGLRTAPVYYNYGNASFRNGKKGQALVAYERARRLVPRDRDLRWNLGVLKASLPDRLESISTNPFSTALQLTSDFVSARELGMVFSLALAALALRALARAIRPSSKRRLAWLGPPLWLVLISAAFLIGVQWRRAHEPRVVVLDKEITARYGPSTREPKAFTLHEGAQGRLLDEAKDWYYITLDDGNTGWLPKNSAEIV